MCCNLILAWILVHHLGTWVPLADYTRHAYKVLLGSREPVDQDIADTFPGKMSEIHNGVRLINIVETNKDNKRAKTFLGKVIAVKGSVKLPGGNADLIVGNGIHLKVIIIPYKEVRPMATLWEVCVIGIVDEINLERKQITIKAKPSDWQVVQTW
jgi:hypothetical protein